ncbi:hypothetical protein [Oleiharenicola lentus]|uniref:hypothetical protein n=1 Tax=Oleiharenicola lentus TaxID=2508720 RepID=UPI003F66A893
MKPWVLWLLSLCLMLIVPSWREAFEDAWEQAPKVARKAGAVKQPAVTPMNEPAN